MGHISQMLFWNYWLGHGNTIFHFINTKQFRYYLNLFSWKYLLSYLCWLSASGFKCQRKNIFSLARPTREIVHQYVVYRNEDYRSLLRHWQPYWMFVRIILTIIIWNRHGHECSRIWKLSTNFTFIQCIKIVSRCFGPKYIGDDVS